MTEPLTVKLRVCPLCNRVSPLPDEGWSGKQSCGGPREKTHKRTKMEPRLFKEVEKEPSQ